MVSEVAIRSKIVALIKSNDTTAKVYPRWRYPANGQVADFVRLFVVSTMKGEDAGAINGYMVRRLQRLVEVRGIGQRRIASVTHVYGIRHYFSIVDSEVDAEASEAIAQARIESLASVFESDNQMGLGATVTHEGLEMPNDFTDIAFGDWLCHRADFRLVVKAGNVEC